MAGNMWGQPQNASMVVFVNDDSTAASYPVNPGMTVAVFSVNDPEHGKVYIKSSQPNGMPNPPRIFELKEVTPQKEGDTVSRQEFNALNEKLAAALSLLEGLQKGGAAK